MVAELGGLWHGFWLNEYVRMAVRYLLVTCFAFSQGISIAILFLYYPHRAMRHIVAVAIGFACFQLVAVVNVWRQEMTFLDWRLQTILLGYGFTFWALRQLVYQAHARIRAKERREQ